MYPQMNVPTAAYGMPSAGNMQMMQQQQSMMQGQNQLQMMTGQRCRGIVKSYSESNGYGFIGGDEVLASVGKDVFLHQREVTEVTGVARPQVPQGAVVTFTVTVNPKGQPQARELKFEDQSFLQMQQMGNAPLPVPGQNAFANEYAQGGRRFKGFVRSFSQINGFGFIGGDEVMQNFGKDVFLHFRELSGVTGTEKPSVPSGTWVTFTVTLNQKGQPQARDVQFEEGTVLAYQQSSTALAASAAVAALNSGWTNPSLLAQQQLGGGVQAGMSDADAYARVQADIAKFQAEVAALRASNAAADTNAQANTNAGLATQDRKRSRSPRAKDEEGNLDEAAGRFTTL